MTSILFSIPAEIRRHILAFAIDTSNASKFLETLINNALACKDFYRTYKDIFLWRQVAEITALPFFKTKKLTIDPNEFDWIGSWMKYLVIDYDDKECVLNGDNDTEIFNCKVGDCIFTCNYFLRSSDSGIVIYHKDISEKNIVFSDANNSIKYMDETCVGVILTYASGDMYLIKNGQRTKLPVSKTVNSYCEWACFVLYNRFISWTDMTGEGETLNDQHHLTDRFPIDTGTEVLLAPDYIKRELNAYNSRTHKRLWTAKADISLIYSGCMVVDSFATCGNKILRVSSGEEVFEYSTGTIYTITKRDNGYGYIIHI